MHIIYINLFIFVAHYKTMKRFIFISMIILLINRCFGFDFNRTVGGRAAAMGGTSVCERSLWSLQNNPAGLAYLEGWHLGLYYENLWMMKETAFKSAGLAKAIPKVGCLGLSVHQFGGSLYSENKFGIAYARDFGPYLQLGLQLDWLLLHWSDNYPNRHAFCYALGLQSQITNKLRLGAILSNPWGPKLGTLHEDRLPIVMRLGLAYQFTDSFIGQCELEKSTGRTGFHLQGGIEYCIFKRFSIRAGAQHNPDLLSFGVGYAIGRLHLDIAAQMHQVTGAAVQLGIGWNGKRKTENGMP